MKWWILQKLLYLCKCYTYENERIPFIALLTRIFTIFSENEFIFLKHYEYQF